MEHSFAEILAFQERRGFAFDEAKAPGSLRPLGGAARKELEAVPEGGRPALVRAMQGDAVPEGATAS